MREAGLDLEKSVRKHDHRPYYQTEFRQGVLRFEKVDDAALLVDGRVRGSENARWTRSKLGRSRRWNPLLRRACSALPADQPAITTTCLTFLHTIITILRFFIL